MRVTFSIVTFYVYFTAAANLLESTGFADALGISANVTAGDKLEAGMEALGAISGGGGLGETLIGLYVAGSNAFEAFLIAVPAGPRLLLNAGIPIEYIVFLHAPLVMFIGRDGLYVLTGRDT